MTNTQRAPAGRPVINLAGTRFGRLEVLNLGPKGTHGGKPRWECRCDCGRLLLVPGARLRSGNTKSCGCFRRDRSGSLYRTHGKSKTREYSMFYDARKRAFSLGLPFGIEPEDISVPDRCPVLGLLLDGSCRDRKPSLDRVVPSLGYVKGNVRVISFRANRIKSDATADELRAVLSYTEGTP